jgi:hypothetical protein
MKTTISKQILNLTTGLFLIFLATSCIKSYVPQYPVYYNVENLTGSNIKIIFNGLVRTQYMSNYGKEISDSVSIIGPGEKYPLCVAIHTKSDKENPETSDTLRAIQILRIYINDSILSNKNFRLTKFWHFYRPNDNEAELDLIVTSNDFDL